MVLLRRNCDITEKKQLYNSSINKIVDPTNGTQYVRICKLNVQDRRFTATANCEKVETSDGKYLNR